MKKFTALKEEFKDPLYFRFQANAVLQLELHYAKNRLDLQRTTGGHYVKDKHYEQFQKFVQANGPPLERKLFCRAEARIHAQMTRSLEKKEDVGCPRDIPPVVPPDQLMKKTPEPAKRGAVLAPDLESMDILSSAELAARNRRENFNKAALAVQTSEQGKDWLEKRDRRSAQESTECSAEHDSFRKSFENTLQNSLTSFISQYAAELNQDADEEIYKSMTPDKLFDFIAERRSAVEEKADPKKSRAEEYVLAKMIGDECPEGTESWPTIEELGIVPAGAALSIKDVQVVSEQLLEAMSDEQQQLDSTGMDTECSVHATTESAIAAYPDQLIVRGAGVLTALSSCTFSSAVIHSLRDFHTKSSEFSHDLTSRELTEGSKKRAEQAALSSQALSKQAVSTQDLKFYEWYGETSSVGQLKKFAQRSIQGAQRVDKLRVDVLVPELAEFPVTASIEEEEQADVAMENAGETLSSSQSTNTGSSSSAKLDEGKVFARDSQPEIVHRGIYFYGKISLDFDENGYLTYFTLDDRMGGSVKEVFRAIFDVASPASQKEKIKLIEVAKLAGYWSDTWDLAHRMECEFLEAVEYVIEVQTILEGKRTKHLTEFYTEADIRKIFLDVAKGNLKVAHEVAEDRVQARRHDRKHAAVAASVFDALQEGDVRQLRVVQKSTSALCASAFVRYLRGTSPGTHGVMRILGLNPGWALKTLESREVFLAEGDSDDESVQGLSRDSHDSYFKPYLYKREPGAMKEYRRVPLRRLQKVSVTLQGKLQVDPVGESYDEQGFVQHADEAPRYSKNESWLQTAADSVSRISSLKPLIDMARGEIKRVSMQEMLRWLLDHALEDLFKEIEELKAQQVPCIRAAQYGLEDLWFLLKGG